MKVKRNAAHDARILRKILLSLLERLWGSAQNFFYWNARNSVRRTLHLGVCVGHLTVFFFFLIFLIQKKNSKFFQLTSISKSVPCFSEIGILFFLPIDLFVSQVWGIAFSSEIWSSWKHWKLFQKVCLKVRLNWVKLLSSFVCSFVFVNLRMVPFCFFDKPETPTAWNRFNWRQ